MGLKIYYQNVRGLRTKTHDFLANVLTHDYDLICLTETWLNSNFYDNEIFDSRYNVFRRDRDYKETGQKLGGGVLIAVKCCWIAQLNLNWYSCNEDIWITLKQPNHSANIVNICCVYLPPGDQYTAQLNMFLDNTSRIITNNSDDTFILTGDFNLPNITWMPSDDKISLIPCNYNDSASTIFIDYIFYNDLKQFNGVQNVGGKILDLILANQSCECSVSGCDYPLIGVDAHHMPLLIEVNFKSASFMKQLPRQSKLYHNADYDCIRQHLGSIDWRSQVCGSDIDQSTNTFHQILDDCITKFVPTKIIKGSNNRFPSWYSKPLIKVIREKLKAHKRWKITNSTLDYDEFSLLRSRQKALQAECYSKYISRTESLITSDPGALHTYIKSKKPQSAYPHSMFYGDEFSHDPQTISDMFNRFFQSAFVDDNPNMPSVLCRDEIDISHIHFTESDITKKLEALDLKKGPGPDGIHPLFIRNCAVELAEPLAYLFGFSLRVGIFPSLWKRSYVTPIHKAGDKRDVKNYRPISKLSTFGKLMERIVVEQLTPVIKPFILPSQHGFFPGRSVESNLIEYTEFILSSMGGGGQVDAIYTDLSKAFDKINHNILLHKLGCFGFHGNLLAWLSSYIRNRLQAVVINNCVSGFGVCSSGVPQGSHLGPILFILYVNDVSSCIQHSKFLIYADDIKLFKKIRNQGDADALQCDVNSLQDYFTNNQLFINTDKCNCITFTRAKNPLIVNYVVQDKNIVRKTEIRDLGVILDSKMLCKNHIDGIVEKAYKQLNFILRVSKPFKRLKTLKILYFTYVRSCLEYASTVWNPQYLTYIDRIERIQNRFLRHLDYRTRRTFDDARRSASYHKIDTLENRRTITDTTYLYKIVNSMTDTTDLLTKIHFNVPIRQTRATPTFRLPTCSTNYAQNSYIYRATSNYNSFFSAIDIFNTKTKQTFKNLLKKSLDRGS
jgi:hypothetical protein